MPNVYRVWRIMNKMRNIF